MILVFCQNNPFRQGFKSPTPGSRVHPLITGPGRLISTAFFHFFRNSVVYRNAMLNTRKYKLRASSCPNIFRNSMETINEKGDQVGCQFWSSRSFIWAKNNFCLFNKTLLNVLIQTWEKLSFGVFVFGQHLFSMLQEYNND